MTSGKTNGKTNGKTGLLLQVNGLQTYFYSPGGVVKAVDGVSFDLREGETLGLVGESGCGKSVTALSIMRLIPDPPGRIVGGQVVFNGVDLLQISDAEMRKVRGSEIAMIFQEPMTSLNPVLTIERQLTEPLELHMSMTRRQATARASELLEMVGIPDPESRLRGYPHQMSGGQRQRVMIAMALSCNPKILIADEATTALDVTIQAQILELMKDLTVRFGTSLVIITHNLGVVARYADRVNVMYAGKIRETGYAEDIYGTPKHPYTVGLLQSVPRLDVATTARLAPIRGEIPSLMNLPAGCAFRDRCDWAVERCAVDDPPLLDVGKSHTSACWEHARVELKKRVAAQ
jgi:oligopeptide/dipeptide ABC transporter ATP-binding protein